MIEGVIIGVIAGGIVAALLFYFLRERAVQRGVMILESERDHLAHQLRVLTDTLESKEAQLLEVSQEKSAAVQRALEIPKLEERVRELEEEKGSYLREIDALHASQAGLSATLKQEQKAWEEKFALLQDAEKKLGDAFEALSARALRNSREDFLKEATAVLEKYHQRTSGELEKRQQAVGALVKPIQEMLVKYDREIQEMERARREAYGGLKERVQSLLVTQQRLEAETGNLVRALRAPQVRGRWGEMTLKRVAELAGMVEHCDFYEQESRDTGGGRLRPDMIVRLPGGKLIVVDAKVPLKAYLEAMESDDASVRKARLKDHARQVQAHIANLANKGYWDQFSPTPEFVALFIPGENFFSAALEQAPNLIEEGVQKGVILATPTTLISLLKAVSYGWRQEKMAESAQAISALGKMLYERLIVFTEHLNDLGKHLKHGVRSYNRAVGSLESRVLPATRRFREMGVSSKSSLKEIRKIDLSIRSLKTEEEDSIEIDRPNKDDT